MQLRVRPPEGTDYELTRKVAIKTLEVIAEEAGPENVAITMGYVGATTPQYTINAAYISTRGPDDGVLRVSFKQGSKIDVFELKRDCGKPWLKSWRLVRNRAKGSGTHRRTNRRALGRSDVRI